MKVEALGQALEFTSLLDTMLRLILAAVAGGILGWERERHDKPAGLRTHMMVALGAAAFMIATLRFAENHPESSALRIDPTRVIAGVIGGVGFLGAGTIIEARGGVRGITTAAGIWVAAAAGLACGLAMYDIAFLSILFAFFILTIVGSAERRFLETKSNEDEAQSGP